MKSTFLLKHEKTHKEMPILGAFHFDWLLVGKEGFEPSAFRPQTERLARLSYTLNKYWLPRQASLLKRLVNSQK